MNRIMNTSVYILWKKLSYYWCANVKKKKKKKTNISMIILGWIYFSQYLLSFVIPQNTMHPEEH